MMCKRLALKAEIIGRRIGVGDRGVGKWIGIGGSDDGD